MLNLRGQFQATPAAADRLDGINRQTHSRQPNQPAQSKRPGVDTSEIDHATVSEFIRPGRLNSERLRTLKPAPKDLKAASEDSSSIDNALRAAT